MGSLSIFADSGQARLVGIARLAADGASLGDGHRVEYFSLPARSLLNRCTSGRMPFTWTINPYRGCEFACKYCYARYTHEFMEMRDSFDFERRIYVKQHAGELLRQELRQVKAGEEIAIGTATDPYQPAERHYAVTRAILEELARHRGYEIGIVSKSTLILRDLEILKRLARNNQLFISITITTMNVEVARILEPRAPRPDLRMNTVRRLNQAGLAAGVICAPILPGITDSDQDLEKLVKATAEANAKFIFANPLFLKPCSARVFLPLLSEKFPYLVESYRQRFASRPFLPKSYHRRISDLMGKLRRKYGLNGCEQYRRRSHPSMQVDEQLALF